MLSWRPRNIRACRASSFHRVASSYHAVLPSPLSSIPICSRSHFPCCPALFSRRTADIVPLRKQLKDEVRIKRSKDGPKVSQPSTGKAVDISKWELTVGIEIHAQLNTERKLFSYAASSVNDEPNAHVAYFDLALPGSLPLFQKATLLPALRAAIALGCHIQLTSRFDRKHYFYHDQPAGYQITQYYEPFAKNGEITLNQDDGIAAGDGDQVIVGIKQIQMEQDTAKSQESDGETTLVDYNRAGQPLIEIISLPQIHSPEAASAYVRKMQSILLSINAVTTGMEMGGLRADINISVRPRNGFPGAHEYGGVSGLGQRTEVKNISTLKGVEEAIKAERNRQIGILEAGGAIEGETRGWSLAAPTLTRRLRGKEGEVDYRYMPDPDISPIIIGDDLIQHLKENLPKLPDEIIQTLTEDDRYGLSVSDAKILHQLDDGERLEYYLEVVIRVNRLASTSDTKLNASVGQLAANWTLHELGSLCTSSEKIWEPSLVPAPKLAQVLYTLTSGKITGSSARQVLKKIFQGDERGVDAIIQEDEFEYRPLAEQEYQKLAQEILAQHPDKVEAIRNKGQKGKIMFLVGQMMRAGEDGRVEAKASEAVLRRLILDQEVEN